MYCHWIVDRFVHTHDCRLTEDGIKIDRRRGQQVSISDIYLNDLGISRNILRGFSREIINNDQVIISE
jgi:hypothetical protein